MLKTIWRSRSFKIALGTLLAWYLRLVRVTSRFAIGPETFADADAHAPIILAMWHGQHFMVPFLQRSRYKISVLISRHGDGEVNAVAAAHFGIGLVRGSGSQRGDQIRKRGGSGALRAMLAGLEAGESMAMTADVPKVARVAGEGIVTLARLSGRPILPVAIVSNRRIVVKSWDRACICLPFGHCAVVFGQPIYVAGDADAAGLISARRQVEIALDDIHRQAYATVGSTDPLADRPEIGEARARAARNATPTQEPGR